MSRLIWLIGASGAGKDTLLRDLRAAAPCRTVVAHRYITRPADAGGENHVALSEEEFALRRDSGLFALHWQAHQYRYALGVEINLWLARGLNVVANGSRLHLPQTQALYGQQLLPVCLKVSPSTLAQRLRQRGREDEAAIRRRLARAGEPVPENVTVLNNDGERHELLTGFLALLSDALSDPGR